MRPFIQICDPKLLVFVYIRVAKVFEEVRRYAWRQPEGRLAVGFHSSLTIEGSPIFVPLGGMVGFWDGGFPRHSQRSELLRALAKDAASVFPVTFVIDSSLARGVSTGLIQGFYSLGTIDQVFVES